jgi:ribosome-binding protein aMBF1 (putative translation factor)
LGRAKRAGCEAAQGEDLITGAQIREARALLGWLPTALARAARMRHTTVQRAEATDGEPAITTVQANAIQAALEAAGVEFTNGGEPGVKLRRSLE